LQDQIYSKTRQTTDQSKEKLNRPTRWLSLLLLQ